VLVVVLLERLVLGRLSRLTRNVASVGKSRDVRLLVGDDGKDELAQLSREIRQMLVELSSAEEAVRLSERQRRELFDLAVTHDFGTPLTVIQSYVDLLAEGLLGAVSDDQAKALKTLTDRLRELQSVRNRMLEASGLDSGSISLTPERVDFRQLVESRIRAADQFAQDRDVKMVANLPEIWLVCDPGRMQQALDNFLISALKYAGSGHQVEVTVQVLDRKIELRFRDRAVAAPDSAAIGGGSGAQRYATGIELALARAIIEAHQGHIFVDVSDPRDTSIGFDVPVPGENRDAANLAANLKA